MRRRSLIRPLALVALAAMTACATPEVRPELAVITSPIDDVWTAFVEVAKEWRFELESLEPSKWVFKGAKSTTTSVGGTVDQYQRFGSIARKQHHDLRVSMRPRDDQSSVIEIVYLIDKIPDEEASFALLNSVRERLTRRER